MRIESCGELVPKGVWRNPHVQTIARSVARAHRNPGWSRQEYCTNHGDTLAVDRLPLANPHHRALFLHGITGCSDASPIPEASKRLAQLGVEPWALNLRGVAGTTPAVPRLYHAGCSEDLESVFWQLPQERPWRLIGFSLGANLLLKWLAELERGLPEAKALAVSCPYDLAACAANLELSPVHRLYRWVLISRLNKLVGRFARRYPATLSPRTLNQCRTFFDFDELVTAPIHGFEGAADYWYRNSSMYFLDSILTETTLLHAADDPFQPDPPLHLGSEHVTWELHRFGGHLGFQMGLRSDWLVARIADFATAT